MTPWNILESAETLVNFMDGYTIWLAPISGILIADYWIVHRQSYSVPNMYSPEGIYRYNKWGTNWRAVIAFVVGWVPLLPGFANSVSGVKVAAGTVDFFYLGYFYGFLVSGGLHVLLSWMFPAKETMIHKQLDSEDEISVQA